MDAHQLSQSLPPGFHWEAPFTSSILPPHLVAVPDDDIDAWLATITPARDSDGAIATIRRHRSVKDHVTRPFRTDAAAVGWVARWLAGQGEVVRAELAAPWPMTTVSG
ncbi:MULTISPECIES: hypothetical protein [unclassified Lysobacter]|uniref:hypothetical protein n=1 Tax=unclassified Lysobacter TaxID=2635362 RepID=UPI001BE78591|nr:MULTISPECIES: hypothetical protein [unclassified Lysobacter]MBT2748269.1 hypothetical protein [Lysobacter sp. ISL-42]MBT2749964.1 hypothetical protein [Lysobacter sp. ISL-50]MBT2781292.1 hypothetical protein [Lysobacter sp. ISL-52]